MTAGLGAFGEAWAIGYLHRLGYRIIDRNVRFRRGELDIVAYDGDELVFVEVKCRRSKSYGAPEESISSRRFEHLSAAVQAYVSEHELDAVPIRLDLLALEVGRHGKVARCNLIRGFEPPRR